MDTAEVAVLGVTLREMGIAWLRFDTPERLNVMARAIQRNLTAAVTEVRMDHAVRMLAFQS